jgi:hypothetical protein
MTLQVLVAQILFAATRLRMTLFVARDFAHFLRYLRASQVGVTPGVEVGGPT